MNTLLDEIISEAYGEQEGTPIPPYTTPPLLAPPTSCPPAGQIIQKTVYGWSQYRRQVGELPSDQQAVLTGLGELIRRSFQPGCQPINLVQIYGYADYDTPRHPPREQQMSQERAQAVTGWLRNYVGAAVAAQVTWDTKGLGATQLKASPTTEAKRRQNRRVEIMCTVSQEITAKYLIYHPQQGYGWRMPAGGLLTAAETEIFRVPEERLSEEYEILGTDDRQLVTDTTAIPFRFICCLDLMFTHPATPTSTFLLRGSGTLISDRHVLTVGHNVLNDLTRLGVPGVRARAARIFAAPGRNGRALPLGRSQAVTMRVTPQWETAPNSQFDFALLTLRDALGAINQATLGNRPLGFWSHPQLGGGTHIRPLELRVLRQQPVNLSGYPSDKCLNQPPSRPASAAEMRACTGTVPGSPELTDLGSTQWRSFGNIVDPAPATEPRSITYDLDSATGHSGGPVWLRWQDFRNLVAVNTGGFPRPTAPFDIIANMGVRITEDVLKQLREWMKADGVSATF